MPNRLWFFVVIGMIMDLLMQVNFLTKLVALKPSKTVQEMIKNVMQGKNEGADNTASEEKDTNERISTGIAGRVCLISLDIISLCACQHVCVCMCVFACACMHNCTYN